MPHAPQIIELHASLREAGLTDHNLLADAVQEVDRDADFIGNTYLWLYAVGVHFRPQHILELGVRFGYGLKSIIAGARSVGVEHIHVHGYDGEVDGVSSNHVAETLLDILGVDSWDLTTCQLRSIQRLERSVLTGDLPLGESEPLTGIDLAHVDADHSPEGTYADMVLAANTLRPGGVLLVDDVNYDHVLEGVKRFCAEFGRTYETLPTYRGLAVFAE